jgi:hypothetical protein
MTHDDHIPDPNAPETPAEKADAKAFGELVDGMLDHAAPPPALGAEQRSLLETATMVRASASDAYDLAPETSRALIDGALAAGAGVHDGPAAPVEDELSRRRARKLAPWVAVAVAAAAALFFALRPPRPAPVPHTAEVIVPRELRSRPADALIGRIDRDRAGDASARLDTIFADRNAGYRAVRFGTLGGDE